MQVDQWNELEVEFNGSELKVKVTPEEQDVNKDYEVEGKLEGLYITFILKVCENLHTCFNFLFNI